MVTDGSAVLGLTLKCARCHSHKFDPLPQRDYYRLLAVFKGAFDEHDWMKSNWHTTLSMGPRSDRDLPVVASAGEHAAGCVSRSSLEAKWLDRPFARAYPSRPVGGNSSVVEHNLAKVGVAGSNPVSRSNFLLP